jgi:hypothetical protein
MADVAPDDVTALKQALVDAHTKGDKNAADAFAAKLAQMQAEPRAPKPEKQYKPMISGNTFGEVVSSIGETAKDWGKSAVSSLAKGVVGLPGMPADIGSIAQLGTDALKFAAKANIYDLEKWPELWKGTREESAKNAIISPGALERHGSAAYQKASGIPFYEPETRIGSLIGMGAEFTGGGGFIGPGSMKALPMARSAIPAITRALGLSHTAAPVRQAAEFGPLVKNVITQGVVPGATSEAAGQATEGLKIGGVDVEPWVRALTAVGTGLAGGAYTGSLSRSEKQLKEHIGTLTREQLKRGEDAFRQAEAISVPITRAQALQYATDNGTGLGALQANIEAYPGNTMLPRMAQQRRDVQAAGTRQIDALGRPATPGQLDEGMDATLRWIRENSPAGQEATAATAAAPTVGAEAAGKIIQPQLTQEVQALKKARAEQAAKDYGQAYETLANVDVTGVERAIERALDVQKGKPAAALENARDLLRREGAEAGAVSGTGWDRYLPQTGGLEGRVEALHNSRMALDDMIETATRAGETNTARLLSNARRGLDDELMKVPGFRQADENFRAASEKIRPYESGAIEPITKLDPVTKQPVAHPSEVTPGLTSPRGADELSALAPPGSPARKALEDHVVTQALQDTKGDPARLRELLSGKRAEYFQRFPDATAALERIATSREKLVTEGLTGRLKQIYETGKDQKAVTAIDVLFPREPRAHSQQEVVDAINTLKGRDPVGTQQLMRAHIEDTWNEAIRSTQGGPRNAPGARFNEIIASHPEQRANLVAAVAATHGDEVAKGFDKFLEVMDMTGRRQGIGSQTGGRQEFYQEAGRRGPVAEIAGVAGAALTGNTPATVIAGSKLQGKFGQMIDKWNKDATMKNLTRLLTDPAAEAQFRAIAQSGGVGTRTQEALTRLMLLTPRAFEEVRRSEAAARVTVQPR